MSNTKSQQQPAVPALTRSPPESPRSSFMSGTSPPDGRRHSLNLPPEVLRKMEQRRASLEKLQPDVKQVSPWMHLYDFTEQDEKEQAE